MRIVHKLTIMEPVYARPWGYNLIDICERITVCSHVFYLLRLSVKFQSKIEPFAERFAIWRVECTLYCCVEVFLKVLKVFGTIVGSQSHSGELLFELFDLFVQLLLFIDFNPDLFLKVYKLILDGRFFLYDYGFNFLGLVEISFERFLVILQLFQIILSIC